MYYERNMSRGEIEAEMRRVKEELADLEETFYFMHIHTNDHLPDALVHEQEQEIYEYRDRLDELRRKLEG